jgi:hypothetical protein
MNITTRFPIMILVRYQLFNHWYDIMSTKPTLIGINDKRYQRIVPLRSFLSNMQIEVGFVDIISEQLTTNSS